MMSNNMDGHDLMVNYGNVMSNPVGTGPRACPMKYYFTGLPGSRKQNNG